MGDDSPASKAAVFLHILFAMLFVASTVTASTLRFAAMRGDRKNVARVSHLLSLVRPLVALVVASLLLVLAFGLWAGYSMGHHMDRPWLIVAYVLVSWMALVGAVAGRHDRHTREMAERLATVESTLLLPNTASASEAGLSAGGLTGVAAGATWPVAGQDSLDALHARLHSPVPLALNISMLASIVVVLAMMVFRPGAVEEGE